MDGTLFEAVVEDQGFVWRLPFRIWRLPFSLLTQPLYRLQRGEFLRTYLREGPLMLSSAHFYAVASS